MILLGIETSCDDTSCAVVEDGFRVLSSLCSSQDEIHQQFGGIVPELASRRHINIIDTIANHAVERAGISFKDIDAIAVTSGPGLAGSLIVGITFASALSYALNLPVIEVNHLEGHILSSLLSLGDNSFNNAIEGNGDLQKFVALIVSGGHTNLYLSDRLGSYGLLGRTVDDAAGEALDKAAKMLNLGYPGGPVIDRMARKGRPSIKFPRPMMQHKDSYNFSFSGLKTALYSYLQRSNNAPIEDICCSFQEAVVDCLVKRSSFAVSASKVSTLLVGGGVSANSRLRERLAEEMPDVKIYTPRPEYCVDNGAMIAAAGYLKYIRCNDKTIFLNRNICPGPNARL